MVFYVIRLYKFLYKFFTVLEFSALKTLKQIKNIKFLEISNLRAQKVHSAVHQFFKSF